MAKLVEVKNCLRCDKNMYNVDIATKYCSECKIEVKRENGRKQSKNKTQKKDTKTKLYENIIKLNPKEHRLTPLGFNEISEISNSSYLNCYRMPWIEILKLYNLNDKLIEYIIKEFKFYMNENNSQDMKSFAEKHQYLTAPLLKSIGYDYLRSLVNIKKLRNNDEDYKNNFFNIVNKIGRVPLYNEFKEISQIMIGSYANHLNLKIVQYDDIVKNYVSNNEYKKYLKHKKEHKIQVGKVTGKLNAIHTDDDYENEFNRVINYCLNEFDQFPSRRLFNKLSKIDVSSYRGKYNKSWTQICEMYGYEVERTANKSEKVILEVVKSIIKEEYIPQHTFDWLRGVNDFVLFCDGYYPKHNLIVEFDGRQHTEPVDKFGGEERFKIQQENDQIKNELIPKHGLKLVRISCYEPFWNKDYVRNKLTEYKVI